MASSRKFETLTPRGKAARVAYDVLQQIRTRKLHARTGGYITADLSRTIDVGTPVCSLLDTNNASACHVCALGGLFMGLALNDKSIKIAYKHYSYDSFTEPANFRVQLKDIFEPHQLNMIESAFEVQGMVDGYTYDRSEIASDDLKAAIRFGNRYTSNENRLRAIMNNIVENRGIFRP